MWTSPPEYCLGGITRANIIKVCREAGIPVFEKRFSLFDVYSADEAFITGTFAGVTPVREVDGRSQNPGLKNRKLACPRISANLIQNLRLR